MFIFNFKVQISLSKYRKKILALYVPTKVKEREKPVTVSSLEFIMTFRLDQPKTKY